MKMNLAALVLLGGCAVAPRSAAAGPEREPDCSYRSATTCWTLGTRFPEPPAEAPDSVPHELMNPPPLTVASAADSATPGAAR